MMSMVRPRSRLQNNLTIANPTTVKAEVIARVRRDANAIIDSRQVILQQSYTNIDKIQAPYNFSKSVTNKARRQT